MLLRDSYHDLNRITFHDYAYYRKIDQKETHQLPILGYSLEVECCMPASFLRADVLISSSRALYFSLSSCIELALVACILHNAQVFEIAMYQGVAGATTRSE